MAARGEAGEYLITNCTSRFGDFIQRNLLADESREIPAPNLVAGKLGDVDANQVHRNVTGDRAAFAGDDGRCATLGVRTAGRAQQSVGITQRGDGDARGAPRRPGAAVADCLAFRHLAQLQDPSAQFDGVAHRIGTARRRIDAVERGARARHLEMRVFAEKNARGVRERRGKAVIEGAQLAKLPDLAGVERMVRKLGARQMTHQ